MDDITIMKVLNLMWSSEKDYTSVHQVMNKFLSAIQADESVNLFVTGDSLVGNLYGTANYLNFTKKQCKKVWSRFRVVQKIRNTIKQQSPDLLVLDGLGILRLLMPWLKKHPQLRVLVYFHGKTNFKSPDLKKLNRLNPNTIRFIAVSKNLAKEIESQVRQIPVKALPTYVNHPQAKLEAKWLQPAVRIGVVGRIVKEKNFLLIPEILYKLKQAGISTIFHIAGEGPECQSLERKLEQYDLLNESVFHGYVANMSDFYRQVDVLLVPSLQEGQCLVLQEALLHDVLVVVSDLEVFKEQLGLTGLYAATTDSGQWVEHVMFAHKNHVSVLASQKKQIQIFINKDKYVEKANALAKEW